MTPARASAAPATRRRLLFACLFLALFTATVLAGRPVAAGAEGGGALTAEPVLSATAAGVRQLFGASPLESPGEVWGVGNAAGERADIVRYTEAGGWVAVPDPVDPEGRPLTGMQIPQLASAGRTTPAGAVVAAAFSGKEGESPEVLAVRDPGGEFRAVPAPAELLEAKSHEELFTRSSVKLAAVEEPGGKTGAFVVPAPGTGLVRSVLHYNGSAWAREGLCFNVTPCPATPPTSSGVIGIDASSPSNAWLLAKLPPSGIGGKEKAEGIVLLRRTEAGEWRKQTLGGELGALYAKQEPPPVNGVKLSITAREHGQPITVTSKGVWIDATIAIGSPSATPHDATIYYDIATGKVTGAWCDLPETIPAETRGKICNHPLGSDLPAGEGRSFAWPGSGGAEEFGSRAITGVGQGAMLVFENGSFSRIPLAGNGGSSAGAALWAPEEGWLGPSYRLTRAPVPSGLQPWPVPFRRPLTAVAGQPGQPLAGLSSEAIAVGARGQVARYIPGQGWQPESLLTGSGSSATPELRGVAWPVPGMAYAVGDEGAMWLWRASTGLWEPDPGAPPNLIRGNFTGIAFDPNEPERGYAVGKQGLLLGYGRRWTQEALPPGLNPEVNITSIAFAGDEALATYTLAVCCQAGNSSEPRYEGGLIVNRGSGWAVEPEASRVLEAAEAGGGEVAPRRVAGLPDGGAVIAGASGAVIEREAPGAPWHAAPGPPLGYPTAVAAIREGGQVRALLSVEGNSLGSSTIAEERASDRPQALGQPPAGQAPLLTNPYPLPKTGYLVRQTATGWRDEERQSYPLPPAPTDQKPGSRKLDLPRTPDPVLGLLINPDGSDGWAVGGQTGEIATSEFGQYLREGLQTGTAMRYGSDAAPPENASTVPIPVAAGEATFAVGGGAQCAGSCADLAGTGIGPDVWLRAAVGKAASIPGLRAFLYTGTSVSGNLELSKVSRDAFGEEEDAYANRLGAGAGSLPVYAAPSETDLYENSLSTFAAGFSGFARPLGEALPAAGVVEAEDGNRLEPEGGNYSYAFTSTGPAGNEAVRVIVLDFARPTLGSGKQCWLAQQMAKAKREGDPAIVVGNREVGSETALQQLLVTGSSPSCPSGEAGPVAASAYLFRAEANVVSSVAWGGESIPAFGSGTLGYTKLPETLRHEYVPASGFLLLSVKTQSRNAIDAAPVTVRLVPSIGSLAIDALDGTLLRRSHTALFEALARRPVAGLLCSGNNVPPGQCSGVSPDPYVQIPARCFNHASCSSEILPEYEFRSSRPDVADFVKVDPTSSNPRAVYLDGSGRPVPDPRSGLLCAFNAGTTTITVKTGGLSYSIPVTVQKGSVQRPCGTVPLLEKPASELHPKTPLPLEPSSSPGGYTSPHSFLPAPAPPGTVPAAHPVAHQATKPPIPTVNFFAASPALTPVPAIVPPPPPPAVQTTPPSGTSPVTQAAFSPEPEEEEQTAIDVVHNMVAHRPAVTRAPAPLAGGSGRGGSPQPYYLAPLFALLLALAAAGAMPRRRSRRLAHVLTTPSRRHHR